MRIELCIARLINQLLTIVTKLLTNIHLSLLINLYYITIVNICEPLLTTINKPPWTTMNSSVYHSIVNHYSQKPLSLWEMRQAFPSMAWKVAANWNMRRRGSNVVAVSHWWLILRTNSVFRKKMDPQDGHFLAIKMVNKLGLILRTTKYGS